MRIRDVETKVFFAQFALRLFAHNFLKDSQLFLPKADYERRHGKFPRYFSGWYLFVPSKDLAEGEVVHKKLNGLDLICYRGKDGKPVVHQNRCPHMDGVFAPMAKVEDGRIVCAYHGYAYEGGIPKSGPREFRSDPSKCIPCFPVREVNDLVMFWYDATSPSGIGEPTWQLDLPDVTRFPRRATMRSITPTHMAPLHENIVDDQHFMNLHSAARYKAELVVYHEKHRFTTKNTMRLPAPKVGPFRIGGVDGDHMDVRMDTEFHGLGVHINYVQIGNFEARIIHCTTPIEDEVTEWTVSIYMEPRAWKLSLDVKTFMNIVYPFAAFAQTYFLHTQDRRVFFQTGEYRFYEDVPKGFEKVNAFRRWIATELLGEERAMGPNCIPTSFVPADKLAKSRRSPLLERTGT